MLLKVATPATAVFVTVPESVETPGFAPKASVTLPMNDVARRLLASLACTTMVGAMITPATVVEGGTLNSSWLAGPAIPEVDVAPTVSVASPALAAVILCAPITAPRVHVVLAWPDAVVVALGG